MRQKASIFYNAMLLTAVHLLLRLAGTSFQVYLSGRIGAAGIGLLQLTMSVGNFALVAGMAGIRTASMYLTAEELGRRKECHIPSVLSGCIHYSLLISGSVAGVLFLFAPELAPALISEPAVTGSLRLFAGFLPVCCLNGVMTGYFTAAGKIRMLAAVEVLEQLFSMTVTLALLAFYAGTSSAGACESVIAGSGAGACLTLLCLLILRLKEQSTPDKPVTVRKKLLSTAVPLAMADLLKTGISTTEHLMVPRRLSLNPATADPLAAFGLLSGMVFPVLMFPACILFGLADLLIPELARASAEGSRGRVRYLVQRSLKVSILYGLFFGGIMALTAGPLCLKLFGSTEAGLWLARYALMVPMLYCDLTVDAMTKGLGQQKLCVCYNIISSGLDVLLLYFLLPRYGMRGYYLSFLITHGLNFLLSLGTLVRITGIRISGSRCILGGISAFAALVLSSFAPGTAVRLISYPLVLGTVLWSFGILGREDLKWFRGLWSGIRKKDPVTL